MTLTFKEFLAETEEKPAEATPKREPLPPVPKDLTAANIKKWEETMEQLKVRLSYTVSKSPGPYGRKHAPRTYIKSGEAFNRDLEFIEIAKKIIEFRPAVDKLLKKYYAYRAKLKLTMSDESIKEIEDIQAEWRKLIVDIDHAKIRAKITTVIKRAGSAYFHATADIAKNVIAQIQFLADIREEMVDVLKRARRTDAQNAAADKASRTMRARWYS